MKYKYCPKCSSELQKHIIDNFERLKCLSCGFILFLNSKPTVGGLAIRSGKVLLVKRNQDPYKDWWDIPGGFLEEKELPEEALKREIKEELNLEIKINKFLGFFLGEYGPDKDTTLNCYYTIDLQGGEPVIGAEIKEIKWFSLEGLPSQIAFSNNREVLQVISKSI